MKNAGRGPPGDIPVVGAAPWQTGLSRLHFIASSAVFMAINNHIYIFHGAIMADRPKRQKPTVGFSARFFLAAFASRKYLALSALNDEEP